MSSIITMNALTMSSREIADLTGKAHAHVMRDIRAMLDELKQNPEMDSVYKSTYYVGANGQSYPQYELDKDLTLTLMLGYDTTARFKVVQRWQELEKRIEQRDPMEMLNDPAALRQTLLGYSEKVLKLEAVVQEQAPKVEAHDRIADATGTLCLRDAAKALQIQPRKLNQWMQANGWIYRRVGKGSLIAYQERIQAGHLTHKLTPYVDQNTGDDKVSEQVRVTGRGLTLLAKRLNVDLDAPPGMIPPSATGAPAQPMHY